MPRHSPCALISLTLVEQPQIKAVLYLDHKNYAGIQSVIYGLLLFYPLLERLSPFYYLSFHNILLLITSVACFHFFTSSLFSFQGARSG